MNHDEVCQARPNWRLARHELIKKRLIQAAESAKISVTKEPYLTPSTPGRRADFQLTGPGAPSGLTTLIDLSLISVISSKAQKAVSGNSLPPSADITSHFKNAARAVSLSITHRYNSKMASYSGKTAFAFLPFVISSSGTLHPALLNWIKTLRSRGVSPLLVRRDLGFIILRARAATFY